MLAIRYTDVLGCLDRMFSGNRVLDACVVNGLHELQLELLGL